MSTQDIQDMLDSWENGNISDFKKFLHDCTKDDLMVVLDMAGLAPDSSDFEAREKFARIHEYLTP